MYVPNKTTSPQNTFILPQTLTATASISTTLSNAAKIKISQGFQKLQMNSFDRYRKQIINDSFELGYRIEQDSNPRRIKRKKINSEAEIERSMLLQKIYNKFPLHRQQTQIETEKLKQKIYSLSQQMSDLSRTSNLEATNAYHHSFSRNLEQKKDRIQKQMDLLEGEVKRNYTIDDASKIITVQPSGNSSLFQQLPEITHNIVYSSTSRPPNIKSPPNTYSHYFSNTYSPEPNRAINHRFVYHSPPPQTLRQNQLAVPPHEERVETGGNSFTLTTNGDLTRSDNSKQKIKVISEVPYGKKVMRVKSGQVIPLNRKKSQFKYRQMPRTDPRFCEDCNRCCSCSAVK